MKNKDMLIKQIVKIMTSCDAIVIGAGSGLSSSAGLTYSGERFETYFKDFIDTYHLRDMYSAGFYPYETLEEYWAYWSRHIYYNRYIDSPKKTYQILLELVKDKDYFVITTNVDHQFQKNGFDKTRLFYTQGDYGLWQCSKPCHQQTYDNEDIAKAMLKQQINMKIPSQLIPCCPHCGAPMTMNLRCDQTFVQDEGWYQAQQRYQNFLQKHQHRKVLYLELGIGANTPVIIKYPFWNYVSQNKNAVYISINLDDLYCPENIHKQSILIQGDIHNILNSVANEMRNDHDTK